MDGQKQPEPTMEEILASIRRIISEDGQNPAPGGAAEAGPADVLELTEVVADAPAAPTAGAEASTAAVSQDAVDVVMKGAVSAPAEARAAAPVRRSADENEPLVSAAAAAGSAAALAGFVGALQGSRSASRDMTVGGATLEDLVRELLRPLLKEWLDANLPDMVERIVQREIARIARRAEVD